MSQATDVRVGIVGAGCMGSLRARALAEIGGVEIAGVSDLDIERARRISPSPESSYSNVGDLLNQAGPDAVIVATSEAAHREAAVKSLEYGAHLLVEKPMATTVEDCDAMIAASSKVKKTLMVGHTLRFDPRYALAAERVQAGEIGSCIHAFCRRNNTVQTPARLGGSCSVLQFLAVHEFDWLLWALSDTPRSVFAAAARKLQAVDDSVFTTVKFARGAVAMVETSWALPADLALGLHAEAQVIGTKGAVFVDGSRRGLMLQSEEATYLDYVYTASVHGHAVGPAVEETRHFIRCVRGEEQPPADGEAGRAAVRLVVAAQRSLDEGREVEFLGIRSADNGNGGAS